MTHRGEGAGRLTDPKPELSRLVARLRWSTPYDTLQPAHDRSAHEERRDPEEHIDREIRPRVDPDKHGENRINQTEAEEKGRISDGGW